VPVNNTYLFGAQTLCRIDDMCKHGLARQRMKHFGPLGAHPGSLPGRKNDDTDISGHDFATRFENRGITLPVELQQ
jgi:hypothetical protein